MDTVTRLATQRAVVVFGTSSCPMSHTVIRLFIEFGVNPAVYELDKDPKGREIERALAKILGRTPAVPAVFIGGKLVGSTENVLTLHMSGSLIPMLKNAGAIWV